jgi:hypothetical protein
LRKKAEKKRTVKNDSKHRKNLTISTITEGIKGDEKGSEKEYFCKKTF